MITTTLSNYERIVDASSIRLVALIRTPDATEVQLKIISSEMGIDPGIEAFLPLALIVAAKFGGRLQIVGRITDEARRAAVSVSRVYRLFRNDRWNAAYPRFHPIVVEAESSLISETRAQGFATYYSGGADSMFSLLEHRDTLTDLFFITNWEGNFAADDLDHILTQVEEVADDRAMRLTTVRIEPREKLREFVSWHFLHGAVLHAVAKAHKERVGRVLIPSSYTVNELEPWGSHPLLDPLWSTSEQALIHDRVDVTRIEKLERISKDPHLSTRLRVCWEPTKDCGVCGKCLRTQLICQVLGMSWRPSGITKDLTPADIQSLIMRDSHEASAFIEIRDYLRDHARDLEICRALESILARFE